MKTCAAKNCNNPVYSHLYCRLHQWKRTDDKYKQYKENKKQGKIAKRSPKRAKKEKYYKDEAREFFDESVKNGTNFCFFCGKKVETFQGLHHLGGRDGEKLLDFNLTVIVHNDCHVYKYHQTTYEQRKEQPWWEDFLMRLKSRSEELWRKEMRIKEKVHKLNPTLFDDEED